MPAAAARALGLLLLVATDAASGVGKGKDCTVLVDEEEDVAMFQLKRSGEQPSAMQERTQAHGTFNYSSFLTGAWPADHPNCMGLPSSSLDHNEWQSPIDISIGGLHDELPTSEAPHFKHTRDGCREGYFHASPVGWQVDFQGGEGGADCRNLVMTFNGTEYSLVQFHFHVVSEHTVGFKPFPGEIHLVHSSEAGELLVVGVFIMNHLNWQRHPFLETVFGAGFETDRLVTLEAPLNPYSLLSWNDPLWHYQGSLTTPPCSPGVQWLVAQKPVHVAPEYLEQFQVHLRAGGGDSYGHNRRPAQALNKRTISRTRAASVGPGRTEIRLGSSHIARAREA